MGTVTDYHLLVMRHAKSDWDSDSETDFSRPLSRRGVKEAHITGKWLSAQGLAPDAVVSSPALRAKDTALIVCDELGLKRDKIDWVMGLYEASLDELLEVIEKYSPGRTCMLLIGHNPGLDSLVNHLSADAPGRTLTGKLMTTSAVAVFDYGSKPVSAGARSARLQKLMRPKELG